MLNIKKKDWKSIVSKDCYLIYTPKTKENDRIFKLMESERKKNTFAFKIDPVIVLTASFKHPYHLG